MLLRGAVLGADRGVRRGRDAKKRPRGAEPNRTVHAQMGKILPRDGAAVEELRREERGTRGRGAMKRPRGAEPNHTVHAQRGKILPKGGATLEELRREERET